MRNRELNKHLKEGKEPTRDKREGDSKQREQLARKTWNGVKGRGT